MQQNFKPNRLNTNLFYAIKFLEAKAKCIKVYSFNYFLQSIEEKHIYQVLEKPIAGH